MLPIRLVDRVNFVTKKGIYVLRYKQLFIFLHIIINYDANKNQYKSHIGYCLLPAESNRNKTAKIRNPSSVANTVV